PSGRRPGSPSPGCSTPTSSSGCRWTSTRCRTCRSRWNPATSSSSSARRSSSASWRRSTRRGRPRASTRHRPSGTSDMAFLSVSGLYKSYATPAGPIEVLRDLSLEVDEGRMVAVMGASGVGKSTLLHVLGGLDHADAGRIVVDGVDITALDDAGRVRFRNARVGFVFQFHHLLPEFGAPENV